MGSRPDWIGKQVSSLTSLGVDVDGAPSAMTARLSNGARLRRGRPVERQRAVAGDRHACSTRRVAAQLVIAVNGTVAAVSEVYPEAKQALVRRLRERRAVHGRARTTSRSTRSWATPIPSCGRWRSADLATQGLACCDGTVRSVRRRADDLPFRRRGARRPRRLLAGHAGRQPREGPARHGDPGGERPDPGRHLRRHLQRLRRRPDPGLVPPAGGDRRRRTSPSSCATRGTAAAGG